MNIIAIDPGTTHTGLVYMDGRRILDARTINFGKSLKNDIEAIRERTIQISRIIIDWIADKPHDVIVVEDFITFSGCRNNSCTHQTPKLVGVLYKTLENENILLQTSVEVFGCRRKNSIPHVRDLMKLHEEVFPGTCRFLTNEHVQSAACHGLYYLRDMGELKVELPEKEKK